ncbi:uncharacterized protein LOC134837154 [Culicoides brevitarsis]|uniref:uncharacterized protein LOC134837154 n=1 Tax=Culicoides brevitarsis TaxID=469753 RepID=UPI00307BE7EE
MTLNAVALTKVAYLLFQIAVVLISVATLNSVFAEPPVSNGFGNFAPLNLHLQAPQHDSHHHEHTFDTHEHRSAFSSFDSTGPSAAAVHVTPRQHSQGYTYKAPTAAPSVTYIPPKPTTKYLPPTVKPRPPPKPIQRTYVPPTTPKTVYLPPSQSYGPPSNSYGPPAVTAAILPSQNYGPPRNVPSAPSSQYGPPDAGYSYNNNGGRQNDDYDNGDAKYEFEYNVKDDATGQDFGHKESRDGSRTMGRYFVLLPDGRKQIVEYYADETGYHPTIRYEDTGLGNGGYNYPSNGNGRSNGGGYTYNGY